MNEALECEKCDKKFAIIPQEQLFYEKMKLDRPVSCPECRRDRRRALRTKRELFHRKCDKCKVELESSYPQESEYTVYCEKCYFDSVA